jgi:hypothetical protein
MMPFYISLNDVLSLCMIMSVIVLLVGRSQSFASLRFVLSMSSTRASNSQKPKLFQCVHHIYLLAICYSKVYLTYFYLSFELNSFWCKVVMNLISHFTFLAFKILTLLLSYVDVMLASCKLGISQTMPSWGKLLTLHFSYLS